MIKTAFIVAISPFLFTTQAVPKDFTPVRTVLTAPVRLVERSIVVSREIIHRKPVRRSVRLVGRVVTLPVKLLVNRQPVRSIIKNVVKRHRRRVNRRIGRRHRLFNH